ncbi:MAG: hypothetical protein JNM70_00680 [Anaerolineae bacterium]|nr:hypothetical protein [Anaerolineae bacterium]
MTKPLLLALLFSLLLLIPFQPAVAQPAGDNEAILYMAYEGSAAGLVLIVSPDGYRAIPMGRYQREQMIASEDGRWLAISVRDTVDDVILWVPIIALDDSGGNTLFPLPITRAVKLGSFSPDGRYLALAVVGQQSLDAPLMGGLMVFDIFSSPESDEQAKWWLPLEPRQGQVMWAEIGDWIAQGVQFLPTCYQCDDPSAGEFALWNPFTEAITPGAGAYFLPDVTVLESTGEALRLEVDAAFPLDPGATGANVIRYLPAVRPDAAVMTLYADPRGIAWAQWVLDGQAVLAQPAGVFDAWVLIYRDGRVVEYPHGLGIRFVVGSTGGWFVESGNADGYTDITHIRPDGSDYLVSADGGAAVIRPPHLGRNLPDPPLPFPPVAP